MKRAVLMALGVGAIITSAAAFSIGTTSNAGAGAESPAGSLAPMHAQRLAREAQRAGIESRYQLDRLRCSSLGGARRDQCLIDAHATRGRSMLAAATPYEARF